MALGDLDLILVFTPYPIHSSSSSSFQLFKPLIPQGRNNKLSFPLSFPILPIHNPLSSHINDSPSPPSLPVNTNPSSSTSTHPLHTPLPPQTPLGSSTTTVLYVLPSFSQHTLPFNPSLTFLNQISPQQPFIQPSESDLYNPSLQAHKRDILH